MLSCSFAVMYDFICYIEHISRFPSNKEYMAKRCLLMMMKGIRSGYVWLVEIHVGSINWENREASFQVSPY